MLTQMDIEPDAVALGCTTGRPGCALPERRLWQAVIRQAIYDRLYHGDERRHTSFPAQETADATAFLFHSQWFVETCEMAGLSHLSIREKIRRVEAGLAGGILKHNRQLIPGRVAFIAGEITLAKFLALEGVDRAKRRKQDRCAVDKNNN